MNVFLDVKLLHVGFTLILITMFTVTHWINLQAHSPYFIGYKMELFSFQNNPKNLDPSYKVDLDL